MTHAAPHADPIYSMTDDGLAMIRIEVSTLPQVEYVDVYARIESETDDEGAVIVTAYLDHLEREASEAQIEYALRAIECNDAGVSCRG